MAKKKASPPINKPTAVQKLRLSKLASPRQLEAMGGDVDLGRFTLQMRNKAGVRTISEITDATIERTIQGASTLTVTLDDAYKEVTNSGRLGRRVDVNVDGLWFTLVAVRKQGRTLTLTFEEREVNVLRYYSSFLMASRDSMTRAEFVLKMIQEVKEFKLKWVIPELHVKPAISDVQGPDQVLVDNLGNPINVGTGDPVAANTNRTGGVYKGAKGLTVRGAAATTEQIANANIIISTGIHLKASRKVIISAIMTAIDESNIKNLTYGDRDSVGVFQQRPSMGWPASRDVATDATAYYNQAIALEKQNPNMTLNDICQGVQRSGTPYAYGAFESEATKIVNAYGVAGDTPDAAVGTQPGQTANNQVQTSSSTANAAQAANGQYFTRGQLSMKASTSSQIVLTKENSWNCMQRLAQEVNWACFVVSGTVYFLTEKWLFQSKPFMTINEDTDGIDWIDYDYDEGKRQATVTISCHLSRWSAPPGSIVAITDMGIINGRWLVNDVQRSLFETTGTITLKKPRPVLPEPTSLTSLPSGFTGKDASVPGNSSNGGSSAAPAIPGKINAVQKKIIDYVTKQLGVPYLWGGASPGVAFDCSGLTMCAYQTVGISLPHFAESQYNEGPLRMGPLQPADLVFFGHPGNIHHVGVYIGNGNMIDAPHHNSVVRVDKDFQHNWPDYYGATCPWTKVK